MENKDKFEKYPYKKDGQPVFFLHLIEWGKTLAMHPPLVDDLNFAVNEHVDGAKHDGEPGRIAMMIGASSLHPDDRYSKELGRKVSMGKMRPSFAWVRKAIIDKKGVLYMLDIPEDKVSVNLFARHGDDRADILNGWGIEG